MSYVKINYRGGQIDPPPAGIGLRGCKDFSQCTLKKWEKRKKKEREETKLKGKGREGRKRREEKREGQGRGRE